MANHADLVADWSPKVTVPALVLLGLTALSAFLGGITPDMLGALGQWAVPAAFAAAAVAQVISGYLKADPARRNPDPETPPIIAVPPAPAGAPEDVETAEATVQAAV